MSANLETPTDDELLLSVGAAAARLGVAAGTLRSWDRRYGLRASGRSEGGHRRFTGSDLDRLLNMQRLVDSGLSPAHSAHLALTDSAPDEVTRELDVESEPRDSRPASRRGGPGGQVLAMPRASAPARGIARAVSRLDTAAATSQLTDVLVRRGVISTWDDVLRPVLVAAGNQWMRTGAAIELEHVLTEATIEALRAYRAIQPPPAPARPVLLACSPEDQHSLPLHALAAALSERQVASRILGGRVPAVTLATAARRIGAGAVFVWRQLLDPAARTDELNLLPQARPARLLVIGGPGWAGVPIPAHAHVVHDLQHAVDIIARFPLR